MDLNVEPEICWGFALLPIGGATQADSSRKGLCWPVLVRELKCLLQSAVLASQVIAKTNW